jgi:hypothetical protein
MQTIFPKKKGKKYANKLSSKSSDALIYQFKGYFIIYMLVIAKHRSKRKSRHDSAYLLKRAFAKLGPQAHTNASFRYVRTFKNNFLFDLR